MIGIYVGKTEEVQHTSDINIAKVQSTKSYWMFKIQRPIEHWYTKCKQTMFIYTKNILVAQFDLISSK